MKKAMARGTELRAVVAGMALVCGLSFGGMTLLPTAGAAQGKPTLKSEDIGQWERLGTGTLSPDGKWFAYALSRNDGTYALRYQKLGGTNALPAATAKAEEVKTVVSGGDPAFSFDSRWLAYSIGYSEDERDKMTKSGKPIQNKLGLADLATGKTSVIDNIASFAFSNKDAFLVMRGYPLKGRESKGADLIVRDLGAGVDTNFGNVAAFAWQQKGSLLAMIVDAENKTGNGVLLFDPTRGQLHTLDSADANYTGLTWRKDADDLAVLRTRKEDAYEEPTHLLLAWTGLAGAHPLKKTCDPGADPAFPKDTRVVDTRELTWSKDGKIVFFGSKEWIKKAAPKPADKDSKDPKDPAQIGLPKTPGEPKPPADTKTAGSATPPVTQPIAATTPAPSPAEAKSAPAKPTKAGGEPAGVEIWHSRDVDIMPEQKVQSEAEKRRNYLTAWLLATNKTVRLTNKRQESVMLAEGQTMAVLLDATPYEQARRFGAGRADLYRLDVQTGQRLPITTGLESEYVFGTSPSGRYLLYVTDNHYWTCDLKTGALTDITRRVPANFIDIEDDHTVKQKPPYGIAGWTKDDRSVLIYDKFDVWEVSPEGTTATRLTNGAAEQIRHRYVSLDPEEEGIDLAKPVYLSLYGERTKQFGYARLGRGETPARLVWMDKNVGRLTKAKNAEVYAYGVQDVDVSPDFWVGGPDLKTAQQVSHTNAFQSKYAWSRGELVNYQNKQGKHLQGALFYPADYTPGKTYPMIVYIYEKLSQGLHTYAMPSERSPYSIGVFASKGYFVLTPDIVYRDRNPGLSAVDCVTSAVEAVLKKGQVDRKRVGLVGHSWGAYQTAFIATQTNLFSAAVAGAPLTDLISMYLSVYWNSGGTDARIFEISQGRMGVPPWEDLKDYMANSPLFNIQKMQTPLMIAFGTQDGAVDWHQGVELYNAARRTGKDLVMLVYEGENHGLAKKPNQLDYHRRILEWFGHYLQGDKAEKWITEGVPYLERQKEVEQARKELAP